MMRYNSFYDAFDGLRFVEVFPTVDVWQNAVSNAGIPLKFQKDDTLSTIYYLLYARYGNDIVASSDTDRFRREVASLLFQYGTTWEKQITIQEELRALTTEQLRTGATEIYNHAFNPSSMPTTQTTKELEYINDQNVSKKEKSMPEAYSLLMALLDDSITDKFLDRFKSLFLRLIAPTYPLLYDVEELTNNLN